MKDDLSVLLASFAVYSNFYAIITIVLSFVAMTIFILRLNNGFQFQTSRENTNQDMMVEQPIIYQSNPFCITLSEVSPSSLKDGLAIYLSSLCSGNLTVFWGPKIEAVFTAMAQDSDTFLTDLEQGKYLQDKCLYAEHVKRLEPDSNQEIHIACPSEVEESHLGQTPRKQYSCILIAALPSSTQYHGSEIIATLSIVHLKDSLLSMESQVLNQFIKTADGKVYSVRIQKSQEEY
ncbi:uncharacterized protein LOC121371517 isoform X2 [Gigantopelta aegis]|uniref:uncharacterized protein LOC121371517 isoform X2 n=1 Tax=Gigantopelta aegis TaxID=1735272 RepID=UPI001B88CE39|nr:uncharacterized protein LOC121371517 isoform X2 [Gigantopelta aegis]